MSWIIGIIFLLLLLLFGVSWAFIRIMTHPKTESREHEFEYLPTWGYDFAPFYASVKPEPFSFRTSRGYELKGEVIPARDDSVFPDGRQRAVILVHGYTANRITMLSFSEIYHRLGFHVVIFDNRYHGDSEGPFCSMGWFEHLDAVELAEHVRGFFPEDTVWGLMGESMGAAITMLAAPKLPWLSFVCEDCGYTSMIEECRASIRYKFNLPGEPITTLSRPILTLFYHYKARWVRPIDAVAEIGQPMLFNHGGLDKFVPTEMVYRLYERKNGEKMLNIFEDVPHAKSSLMHHEDYYAMLKEFLEKYALI